LTKGQNAELILSPNGKNFIVVRKSTAKKRKNQAKKFDVFFYSIDINSSKFRLIYELMN